MHDRNEVPEKRKYLDSVEAQYDGELLLEDAHDLEGLEQLDDAKGFQGSQDS